MSPKARDIKERINKWDFIKIKSFMIKENISKMTREPTIWENILANDTTDILAKGFDPQEIWEVLILLLHWSI